MQDEPQGSVTALRRYALPASAGSQKNNFGQVIVHASKFLRYLSIFKHPFDSLRRTSEEPSVSVGAWRRTMMFYLVEVQGYNKAPWKRLYCSIYIE